MSEPQFDNSLSARLRRLGNTTASIGPIFIEAADEIDRLHSERGSLERIIESLERRLDALNRAGVA